MKTQKYMARMTRVKVIPLEWQTKPHIIGSINTEKEVEINQLDLQDSNVFAIK